MLRKIWIDKIDRQFMGEILIILSIIILAIIVVIVLMRPITPFQRYDQFAQECLQSKQYTRDECILSAAQEKNH